MKKIRNRSLFTLIITAAVVLGLLVYIILLWANGENWVMLRANQRIFSQGVLNTGTLTDRNGTVLASAGDGIYRYADDETLRRASIHVVGDYGGNIGTGALNNFTAKLAGYSFVDGVNSLRDEGAIVALSIDAELQTVAYNALAGRRGVVLVMNYETGEILCMVSTPSFDPNAGLNPDSPMESGAYINRAISSTYVPGSVFKLVTLAASVENIPDLHNRSFYCGGSVQVGGDTVNCTGVHGNQTIEVALAHSCNCAFSELSQELGSDTLAKYAKMMGLTDSLTLDGIPCAAGNFDKAEPDSSLLSWSGIGQHTDLVSPYAMLRLVAAIANDGELVGPTILKKGTPDREVLLSPKTAEAISDMMNYNVVYSYGESLFPGVKMHAKTGTAEVGDGSSHAWFVGFTGGSSQRLAFTVILENAGGGLANAAPVANAVIQAAIS